VTKIFIVAISFGAALAVFPAAAQTGYGVKKNAPSTSTFGTTRTKVRIGRELARLGCAITMLVHSVCDQSVRIRDSVSEG
jgi:hypothetical protein